MNLEESSALVPDALDDAFKLVRTLSAVESWRGEAIVTHGEVIHDVLRRIAREDGIGFSHELPGAKGCAWILEFRRGTLEGYRYLAPSES